MDLLSYAMGKNSAGGGTTPTGTINITANGNHNVTNYATANVNVPTGGAVIDNNTRFANSQFSTLPMWLQNADWTTVTDMREKFSNCTSLTTVSLNLPLATTLYFTFYGDSNLTTATINAPECVNMTSLFQNCSKLTTVSLGDTSKVQTMQDMFRSCSKLENVSVFSTASVTNMSGMFSYGSGTLSNESLNNILYMCAHATSYTGTKTTSTIGLYGYNDKLPTLSNYQAFLDAGWTIA